MKKQNKRNQFTRMALALLLILSMLGNTLIFPTVAQETVAPVDNTTSSETPSADEATTDATLTPTLPEPIQLTAADIPEFISAAALQERGAVERMRSEETNMSSVIFRNSDGTRTMYMYGLPVKYTSADGTVRDKSTNLVSVSTASVLLSDQPVAQTMAQMSLVQQEALQAELGILDVERAAGTLHMLSTALTARQRSLSDMAYTTLDNDVYALFPTNLAKGMTLVFGEHSVRMTPAGTGMTVTAGGNVTKTTTSSLSDVDVAERLLYPNVFGLGTAVQYTPTLTGVKEEILLSRNVGKNSFAFLLETGGLVLAEQSGQFILIDPETEQQVGKLGEIIVFDSAGQVVRGNMTAQTILAGQKYGITISVDAAFLASATYPVSIDPTLTTYATDEDYYGEYNLIEDVAVYNHEDAWGYTFEAHHYLGTVPYTNVGTYIGYALYRFPVFYDSSIPSARIDIDLSCLGAFKLHLKSITPTATPNTYNLYTAPYQADWDDNARICSFQASCYCDNSSALCSNVSSVPAQGTFEVDLTEYLEYWINVRDGNITTTSTADFETGVAIGLAGSGTLWLEPISYDADVYATYEYSLVPLETSIYLNSLDTRTFLAREDDNELIMKAGTISEIGTQIAWEIVYRGQDRYTIHPAGNRCLYLNEDAMLVDDPDSYSCYWFVEDSTTTDGVVFTNCDAEGDVLMPEIDGTVIVVSGTVATDAEKAWRAVEVSSYVEMPDISNFGVTVLPTEQASLYWSWGDTGFTWDTYDNFSVTYISGVNATYNGAGVFSPGTLNGCTKFSITHLPTGQDFYYYLNSADIPDLAVRKIFSAADTTKCLQASGTTWSNSLIMAPLANETEGNIGGQMWGIRYVGDGNFIITSLGVRDSNFTDNMALSAFSSGVVRLRINTGLDSQKWRLFFDGVNFKLYNVAYPNLGLDLSTTNVFVSTSPTNIQIVAFDLPSCVHPESYSDYLGGALHVKVIIDDTAIGPYTSIDVINNAIIAWNELNPNVIVYRSTDTAPANAIVVTIYGSDDTSDPDTLAEAFRMQQKIILYKPALNELKDVNKVESISKTITHEMGHALFMKHPYEDGFGGNNYILSVMNQNRLGANNMVTITPSVFDIINFRNKWTGEE